MPRILRLSMTYLASTVRLSLGTLGAKEMLDPRLPKTPNPPPVERVGIDEDSPRFLSRRYGRRNTCTAVWIDPAAWKKMISGRSSHRD